MAVMQTLDDIRRRNPHLSDYDDDELIDVISLKTGKSIDEVRGSFSISKSEAPSPTLTISDIRNRSPQLFDFSDEEIIDSIAFKENKPFDEIAKRFNFTSPEVTPEGPAITKAATPPPPNATAAAKLAFEASPEEDRGEVTPRVSGVPVRKGAINKIVSDIVAGKRIKLAPEGSVMRRVQDAAMQTPVAQAVMNKDVTPIDPETMEMRSATELAKDIGLGVAQSGVHMARGITYLSSLAGVAEPAHQAAQKTLSEWGEALEKKKSSQSRAISDFVSRQQGFVSTMEAAGQNPAFVAELVAQSSLYVLPSLATAKLLGTAGKAALGTEAVKNLLAKSGMEAAISASSAGGNLASITAAIGSAQQAIVSRIVGGLATAGAIAGEGLMVAGTTGADVEQAISSTPFSELRKRSDRFNELSQTMDNEEARKALARELSAPAALKAGAWTSLISGVSGAGAFTGQVATGAVKPGGVFAGMGKETVSEAIQEPGEQFFESQAKVQAGLPSEFDVGQAAALGAVGALGQAGVLGAISGLTERGPRTRPQPSDIGLARNVNEAVQIAVATQPTETEVQEELLKRVTQFTERPESKAVTPEEPTALTRQPQANIPIQTGTQEIQQQTRQPELAQQGPFIQRAETPKEVIQDETTKDKQAQPSFIDIERGISEARPSVGETGYGEGPRGVGITEGGISTRGISEQRLSESARDFDRQGRNISQQEESLLVKPLTARIGAVRGFVESNIPENWKKTVNIQTAERFKDLPPIARKTTNTKNPSLFDKNTNTLYLVSENIDSPELLMRETAKAVVAKGGISSLNDDIRKNIEVLKGNKIIRRFGEILAEQRGESYSPFSHTEEVLTRIFYDAYTDTTDGFTKEDLHRELGEKGIDIPSQSLDSLYADLRSFNDKLLTVAAQFTLPGVNIDPSSLLRSAVAKYTGLERANVAVEFRTALEALPEYLTDKFNVVLSTSTNGIPSEAVGLSHGLGSYDDFNNTLYVFTDKLKSPEQLSNVVSDSLSEILEPEKALKFSTAFHGSPYDFEKFTTEKIGTGEGGQAFGHGLYFTDKQNIAEYYKTKLVEAEQNLYKVNDGRVFDNPRDLAGWKGIILRAAVNDKYLRAGEEGYLSREIQRLENKKRPDNDPELVFAKSLIGKKVTELPPVQIKGKVYQVDLKPQEDEYLLWDKFLYEQSDKVLSALKNIDNPVVKDMLQSFEMRNTTGEDLYNAIISESKISNRNLAKKEASDLLHTLGVRGIKYLDQASRAEGKGTYNYVIFSDEDVEIKQKYSLKPSAVQFKSLELTKSRLKQDIQTDIVNKWADKHDIKSYNTVDEIIASNPRYKSIPPDIDGFYDPATDTVNLVLDNIPSIDRAKWVVAHEIVGHAGLSRLGEPISDVVNLAKGNKFIQKLSQAIARNRFQAYEEHEHTEEALAELTAAFYTGEFNNIYTRYNLEVPPHIRDSIEGLIKNFIDKIRKAVYHFLGKTTDSQIYDLINRSIHASEAPIMENTSKKGIKFSLAEPMENATLDDFSPEKIDGILNKGNWVIFTGWNPNAITQSDEANESANRKIKQELKERGLKYDIVWGRYQGDTKEAESFLVYGVPREDAVDFARRYGQQSVFTHDGILYSNNTINEATGITTFNDTESALKAGGYTRIPDTGVIFSGDINWDSLTIPSVHYGPQRYTTLKGENAGKGLVRPFTEEGQRIAMATDPRLKTRLDFYVNTNGKGVRPEAGLGYNRHEAMLKNIYNADDNPLKLSTGKNTPEELNAFESAILDAGFDGYFRDIPNYQGLVRLLGDAAKDVQVLNQPNNLRFSRADILQQAGIKLPPTPQNGLPEETWAESVRRKTQDDKIRFKKIQDLLKKRGINLPDSANVYQKENLSKSKTANRIEDFREQQLKSFLKDVAKQKVKLDDITTYLEALHIPEANARQRLIHKDPDATASGITDTQAKKIVSDFQARANFKSIEALSKRLRAFGEETLDMSLKAGLVSPEQYQAYKDTYKVWVPLRGDLPDTVGVGTGQGISTSFRPKGRFGHELRAEERILENLVQERERVILLDEKNKVGMALAEFIMLANDPEIGTIGKPEKRAVLKQYAYQVTYQGSVVGTFERETDAIKEVNNLITSKMKGVNPVDLEIHRVADPRVAMMAKPTLAENEVQIYMGGHTIKIQLNDPLLARAAKNGGTHELGDVLNLLREFNRHLSKMYTAFNPDFITINPIRDLYSGTLVLTGEKGITFTGKTLSNYPIALKELIKARNDPNKSKWVKRYRDAGGNIGAAWISDLERIGTDAIDALHEYASISDVYNMEYDSLISLGASKVKAHSVALAKTGLAKIKVTPVISHLFKLIEKTNAVTENALRLSTFKAAVEAGETDQQAAMLARDLINFNRHGELNNTMSALWLFYNPSVQGVQLTGRALFTSPHRGQVWGLLGAITALSYILAEIGRADDEEEWKAIPEHIKDRNLVLKFGGKMALLPVAYGWGFAHTMGRLISDLQHGEAIDKVSLKATSSFVENFSPVGSPFVEAGETVEFQPFQLLPTFSKMLLGPGVNMNSFGHEIYPRSYAEGIPDSALMTKTIRGTAYQTITDYLNETTGGSKVSPGYVSISPNVLRFWVTSLTGGAGKFASDMVSGTYELSQGVVPETENIPIVRKFFKEPTVSDSRSSFYKALDRVKAASNRFNRAVKAEDFEYQREAILREGRIIDLLSYANETKKLANERRDLILKIQTDSTRPLKDRKAEIKKVEEIEKKYYDNFLKVFSKAEKG